MSKPILWANGATSIDLSVSVASAIINIEGKRSISITIDETVAGAVGNHVGCFYVKSGDQGDGTNWQAESPSPVPSVASGVEVHHRISLEGLGAGLILYYVCDSGSCTAGDTVAASITLFD